MNNSFNFEQMSLAELEALQNRLANEKLQLEGILRQRENLLSQEQSKAREVRTEILNYIEKIIALLLPDLSDASINRTKRIFSDLNLPATFSSPPAPAQNLTLLQKILAFFAKLFGTGEKKNDPLEQSRIALRDRLWRLNQIPNSNPPLENHFRALLEFKTRFFAAEKHLNELESQANQAANQLKSVISGLQNCGREISRRNTPQRTNDSTIFDDRNNNLNSSTQFDHSNSAIWSSSHSTNVDSDFSIFDNSNSGNNENASQGATALEASEWGGAGAGGSWENYS